MAHPGEQADELHLAIAKLGYKNPIIIGHSWGGSVAMAYAQRHGDAMTGAVILAAPLYPWDNKPAWYNRMVTWPLVGRLLTHSVVTQIWAWAIASWRGRDRLSGAYFRRL